MNTPPERDGPQKRSEDMTANDGMCRLWKKTCIPAVPTNRPFSEAKAEAFGIEEDILAADGGSANDREFAALVGCSLPQLLARSARHEYFSIRFRGHRYWPRWQLGLAGLAEVLPVLAKKGASGFSVVLFFTTVTDTLSLDEDDNKSVDVREDDSPLSLLHRCGTAATRRVLRHAHRFGEQGAT